jgi:two-component system phosphate regulon response regulator PhoB
MNAQRILIVDDERDLVSTLAYNLEREGFATTTADTGKAALERAAEGDVPDLIILDLMLPDLSGTEVCRRLRRQESTRSVPVLMLTAKGEEVDRVVGFEVGADDYVVKPFSPRELVLRVDAILRRATATTWRPRPPRPSRSGSLVIDVPRHSVRVEGQRSRSRPSSSSCCWTWPRAWAGCSRASAC